MSSTPAQLAVVGLIAIRGITPFGKLRVERLQGCDRVMLQYQQMAVVPTLAKYRANVQN